MESSSLPDKIADVFISSTFMDMQRERNILSRIVFPSLRKSFQHQYSSLREIDLRWGVTETMSEMRVQLIFA